MAQEKDALFKKTSRNELRKESMLQKPKGKVTETFYTLKEPCLFFQLVSSPESNNHFHQSFLLGHNSMQTLGSAVEKKWLRRTQELPFVTSGPI